LHQLELVAGQPGGQGWVDGVGKAAHFTDPWTFASDGQGRLFVADASIIRAIDLATGTVTTLAGTGSNGGTDGPVAQASFNVPSGLAYAGGMLYVADTENHTVRRIDLAAGMVTTIAGTYGMPGATDDVGAAARFVEPEGIALDGAGNLFIADTDNNTIRKMVLATGTVSTLAGTAGMVGAVDAQGMAARFAKPKALAYDGAGTLYVLDNGNASIRKVTVADGTVGTLVTPPTLPYGLETDGAGVVASLGDHSIVRVDATGAVTPLAGAAGKMGFADGTTDGRFDRPSGLWNDRAGSLYVADEGNFAVRKVALATGAVSTIAGANSIGSADGTGSDARFWGPQAVVVDGKGVAYVADTNNNTIRSVELATGATTTIAGMAGQAAPDDGTGTGARFNQPSGLALDDAARLLYIADGGNRTIRKLALDSGQVTTLRPEPAMGEKYVPFGFPNGLALDGPRLVMSDYMVHVLYAIDLPSLTDRVLAGGANTPGARDGVGAAARFDAPGGLAADGRGALYVADVLNDAIRKVNLATGEVSTLAGTPNLPGAQDGVGAGAGFSYPVSVAVDGVGDLYVADSLNSSVRHVDTQSGAVTLIIGSRQGVSLGPLPAQISHPAALALTPDAKLLLFSENALLRAD
jgi:sugar lactone lactonase YvrE